jgi:bis(5'-nucleosyl)-tetraphosphatase (symmetrical)
MLRSDDHGDFLKSMYGREPTKWQSNLTGMARLRFITNSMTRMRFVDEERHLDFEQKGPPGKQPETLMPWYQHPKSKCKKWRVVCGHWSALGYMRSGRIIALDSGCVWGGALTAVRLDGKNQRQLWQVGCSG